MKLGLSVGKGAEIRAWCSDQTGTLVFGDGSYGLLNSGTEFVGRTFKQQKKTGIGIGQLFGDGSYGWLNSGTELVGWTFKEQKKAGVWMVSIIDELLVLYGGEWCCWLIGLLPPVPRRPHFCCQSFYVVLLYYGLMYCCTCFTNPQDRKWSTPLVVLNGALPLDCHCGALNAAAVFVC